MVFCLRSFFVAAVVVGLLESSLATGDVVAAKHREKPVPSIRSGLVNNEPPVTADPISVPSSLSLAVPSEGASIRSVRSEEMWTAACTVRFQGSTTGKPPHNLHHFTSFATQSHHDAVPVHPSPGYANVYVLALLTLDCVVPGGKPR